MNVICLGGVTYTDRQGKSDGYRARSAYKVRYIGLQYHSMTNALSDAVLVWLRSSCTSTRSTGSSKASLALQTYALRQVCPAGH